MSRRKLIHAGIFSTLLCLCGGWHIRADAADDQSPQGVHERIAARSFPSVFQAWNGVGNLPKLSPRQREAKHDLLFHAPDYFGLRWNAKHVGLADGFETDSIIRGIGRQRELLKLNPNMILLAEIRYRDAHRSYLPDDHKWWKRDGKGSRVVGWKEGGYFILDFANPAFHEAVARRAAAAVKSGVFDGIMLDWWGDDADRLALIKRVRNAIGKNALILVNANDRRTPKTAPHINGYFMECYQSSTLEHWKTLRKTLLWAEGNLRKPRINCLETWFHHSRKDLALMRVVTTLSLTHSNGYCLFSDPNPLPTPDHLHNWYTFWDRSLGRPTGKLKQREDGGFERAFEHGEVIFNPPSNQLLRVTFKKPMRSAATGKVSRTHDVAARDGDIFLSVKGPTE